MMDCPTCNRRLVDSADRLCRRCGTNLGTLCDLEAEAATAVRASESALRTGDLARAQAWAKRARLIDPQAADGLRCAALVALARRDFAVACDLCARHGRVGDRLRTIRRQHH